MEYILVRNSSDLKAEILRLEGVSKHQGEVLKAHFSSPSAIFSTIFSMFRSPSNEEDEKGDGIFNQDFLGLISRVILPLILNKTLFRNSNFIIKALVGLVSQKASHYISEDSVGNIWHKIVAAVEEQSGGIIDKVKGMFESKKPRKAVNHPKHAPAHRNVLKETD